MNIGDRVKHKRLGIGTIKQLYPKNSAVRVLYDSGHETTNAQSRVQVLTAGQGVSDERPKTETAQPVRRRGSAGTSQVDYDQIERTRKAAAKVYPEADEIVGRWYGSRGAYVEVYNQGSAAVVFHDQLGVD